MADSDRSRSPAPGRNRHEPRGQAHAPRPGILPEMAWTYELVNLALSDHAKTSVSISVGNQSADLWVRPQPTLAGR